MAVGRWVLPMMCLASCVPSACHLWRDWRTDQALVKWRMSSFSNGSSGSCPWCTIDANFESIKKFCADGIKGISHLSNLTITELQQATLSSHFNGLVHLEIESIVNIRNHFYSNLLSHYSILLAGMDMSQYLADSPPTVVPLIIKPHFEALTDEQKLYAHHISK